MLTASFFSSISNPYSTFYSVMTSTLLVKAALDLESNGASSALWRSPKSAPPTRSFTTAYSSFITSRMMFSTWACLHPYLISTWLLINCIICGMKPICSKTGSSISCLTLLKVFEYSTNQRNWSCCISCYLRESICMLKIWSRVLCCSMYPVWATQIVSFSFPTILSSLQHYIICMIDKAMFYSSNMVVNLWLGWLFKKCSNTNLRAILLFCHI